MKREADPLVGTTFAERFEILELRPFTLEIVSATAHTARGTLDWPNYGVRTRFVALHDGNQIVVWEPELVAGVGEYVDSYALRLPMPFMVTMEGGREVMRTPVLSHGDLLEATRER